MKRLPLALFMIVACNRGEPTQAPEAATAPDEGPDVGGFEFVSTNRDDRPVDHVARDDGHGDNIDRAAFEVTTVEQARELAEAAVAKDLNPKRQWKTSPVLPAEWPSAGPRAMFLFYPMAQHPQSMERYELFSAQWAVVVSLTDGSAEVTAIPKSKRLGTIEEGRPSVLERQELEMAEAALIVHLLGGNALSGENRFWGYLKYFHEHPQLGNDITRRRPKFVKWLKGRAKQV